MRKNSDVQQSFVNRRFTNECFEVYREHSVIRYGRDVSLDNFFFSFYQDAAPGLQSEFYIDNTLVGIGYLDRSSRALSSVYFAFRPAQSARRLGVFSALAEIAHARTLGLEYYYLGYYIENNPHMAYKDQFKSNQKLDWDSGAWE